MTERQYAYVAGFLDGDGCLMAQLVRRKDYSLGYQIRLSLVFYQKTIHRDHLEWLRSKLKSGYVRDRNDGMSEYTIVGQDEVRSILVKLLPHLRLKRRLARILVRISYMPRRPVVSELLRYARLVDESALFAYSKKRTNSSRELVAFLEAHYFPVSTDSRSRGVTG